VFFVGLFFGSGVDVYCGVDCGLIWVRLLVVFVLLVVVVLVILGLWNWKCWF
jgi:hypothetical protein